MILAQSAVDAFNRREFRLSADKYLEATKAAPSVWSENRYQIFTGYTSILTEKYFVPRDSDFEELKRFKRDRSEPCLFRTEAAFSLALLLWTAGDRIAAAEAYRSAIRIGGKAKESERKKVVISMNGVKPLAEPYKSVGDIINWTVNKAQENLAGLESPLGNPPSSLIDVRSDGSVMPTKPRSTFIPTGPLAPPMPRAQVDHLLSVGGGECDHCRKTLQELGVGHLKKCNRCKRAFYCSTDCQKSQWHAGHKDACRKPGQIERGDYMRLDGLVRRPQLNGTVVQIIRPLSDQPGRFEVRIHGGDTSISVAKESLQHMRPLK